MPTIYNKVTIDDTTLLDLSQDTVSDASHIRQGYVGHLNDGTQVTGTYSGGGGASNLVVGTFTGTTTGAAMNVTIPYTGSGYPILVEIEPSDGYYGSGMNSVIQRYATIYYLLSKAYTETASSYSGSGNGDLYMATNVYKNSSSEADVVGRNGGYPSYYANSSANASGSANGTLVYLHSATEMSVYIASTSYGFRANTEYTYRILYSS